MSKTYATITALIQQEIRPAIATDETLSTEQIDAIADEVCTRLQAGGWIVWEDGYSERDQVYWLPAQGFAMALPDDDGATLWDIVAEVLDR